MTPVRVGLIGYKFIGSKAHSHAYHDQPFLFPIEHVPMRQVICGHVSGAR